MALGDNEMESDNEFINDVWNDEESSEDEMETYLHSETWSETPPVERLIDNGVHYEAFTFTGPDPGPTGTPMTPLESFQQFLCDEALDLIVSESNKMRKPKKDRQGNFVIPEALTKNELMVFIAVLILTEIHSKNHLKDNWSTDGYLETPIFSKLMSV